MTERDVPQPTIVDTTKNLISDVVNNQYVREDKDAVFKYFGYSIDREVATNFLIQSQIPSFMTSIMQDQVHYGNEVKVGATRVESKSGITIHTIQLNLDAHAAVNKRLRTPNYDAYIYQMVFNEYDFTSMRTYYTLNPRYANEAIEVRRVSDNEIEKLSRILRFAHESTA